jgi:putative nucleotidyltransferase with HDIG domain
MFGVIKKSARLGQWNGRTRSSRESNGVLHRLGRREVLIRLAPVLLTALTVTSMVYSWGPHLPYRVGEVLPNDIRVRVYFEVVDQPQTEWKREEAVEHFLAVEGGDPAARELVRHTVPPVVEKYPPGMPLVQRGVPITEHQLAVLEEEHRAYQRSLRGGDHARRGAALFLIMGLLSAVVVLYVCRFQPALAQSVPKISAICALAIVTIGLALTLSRPPWYAAIVPLTVTAMVLTLAYNPPFALLMSFSLSLATTVALGTGLNHLLIQMGGLATAVLLLCDVRTRTRLVQVATGAGIAYMLMTVATGLLSGQSWQLIAFDAGRHLAWGALGGFLLSGSLPLVERGFGVVTDISLLELADGSHPLLQELIRRAPGTYTHSMTVANLAEAAAESVGANPLLTRVGSYFHDVGKMLKPAYFIENQSGENRHDVLEPALSTLIIIGHVKDGVALAGQYNLPRPIMDFIQQHHGTTLVEYFYHEAMRLQAEAGAGAGELESSFRYPGPKPQNREIGIVMLADAVESASRALVEPAPASLSKLVHDLLMKRLLDGQFEQSGLTLTELHRIEQSLCKSLIALYHARIRYPEARGRNLAS